MDRKDKERRVSFPMQKIVLELIPREKTRAAYVCCRTNDYIKSKYDVDIKTENNVSFYQFATLIAKFLFIYIFFFMKKHETFCLLVSKMLHFSFCSIAQYAQFSSYSHFAYAKEMARISVEDWKETTSLFVDVSKNGYDNSTADARPQACKY